MEVKKQNKSLVMLWGENFKNDNEKQDKEVIKIYNLEQAAIEIKNLSRAKAKFEVKRTSSSCKITVFGKFKTTEYWYLENTKSIQFLILLNRLKKEILEREELVKNCSFSSDVSQIKYFYFAPSLRDLNDDSGSVHDLEGIDEADVSHAYYRAAYVLGFISDDLYQLIIKTLSKEERLRLLGCIAAVKTFEFYVRGEQTEINTNKNDKAVKVLRAAWFKICHYIDSCLLHLKNKLGTDFLFYWVDGIYYRRSLANDVHVTETAEAFNLEFKITPLEKFQVVNKGSHVELYVFKTKKQVLENKPKRFFPTKEQIKSYSIIGLNELNSFKNS